MTVLTEIILRSTSANQTVDLLCVLITAETEEPTGPIETFLNVVEQWPAQDDAAFVLISETPGLTELIAAGLGWRRSPVQVLRAAEDVSLRPRTVHVVPSKSAARIEGDMLRVGPVDPAHAACRAEALLASLAESRGASAVALVLGPGPEPAAHAPIDAAGGTIVHVPRAAPSAGPVIAALRDGLHQGRGAMIEADAATGSAPQAAAARGAEDFARMLLMLLDCSADALIMLDPEARVRHFTAGATRHFDLLERDIGRPLYHLATRVWDPTLHADIHEAGLSGVPISRDLPIGPDRWTNREVRIMRDGGGRNTGFAIVYRDVSSYRQMLKSLARAEMKAREVEGGLRLDLIAFAKGIGRRLRTLETLIELIARGSDDRAELGHEASEVLAAARGRLGAIERMHGDMLGIHRRRTGFVALGGVFGALAGRVAARAARQGVTLRVVPASLGAQTDPALLVALLEAVLDEHLSRLDGGRVVIGCRRAGDSAGIVIAHAPPDAAIPAEEATPGPTRSIALWIAESLGVRLRRMPGGCVIGLPLMPMGGACTDPQCATPQGAAPRVLGARILVVLRDGHERAVVLALIRAEGHAALAAPDIATARAMLLAEPLGVDLVMGEDPDGTGALGTFAAMLLPRADGGPVPHLVLPRSDYADDAEPQGGLGVALGAALARRYAASGGARDPKQRAGWQPVLGLIAAGQATRDMMAAELRAEGARVGVFAAARDLVHAGDSLGLSAVLLDVGSGGEEVEAQLRELVRVGPPAPIVVLGTHGDPAPHQSLREAGALGVIHKPATAAMILSELREILEQSRRLQRLVIPATRDGAPDPAPHPASDPPLTPRQRDVLEAVLEGQPSKIIAHRLGISQRTVESHRAAIMRAFGARSLPDLVRRVLASGESEAPPDPGLFQHFRHGNDRKTEEEDRRPLA